jgi:hypothetical protein
MTAIRIFAPLLALLSLSPLAAAPLFDESGVVEAFLEGPLSDVMSDTDNREELPFLLRVGGTEHTIKMRLRGKSRARVCDFPPLRLNFRKSEVEGTLFADQDKLKLVVPCETSERAEKNLIEEYAVYRIFNLLTPASYRVRLMRTSFTDSGSGKDSEQLYTFALEPSEQLAARLGGRESEISGVALSWLDADHIALVYVFQYLVGNVDWSLVTSEGEETCCHNGTLIEIGDKLLYVPYDFDLSGFVNAPYAFPPAELHIDKVTQRRYRGFCTERDTLGKALDFVASKRPDIVELIESLPVLSDRDKTRRIGYLDQFFRAAANPDRLLSRFEKRCID